VSELWCYPVKSMQGQRRRRLDLEPGGVGGDRRFALVDDESGKLMTAKRHRVLLEGAAVPAGEGEVAITLPGGAVIGSADPDADARLSAFVGRPARLATPAAGERAAYEMTFDPPDDDAELVDVPTPPGTFLDLAPVHLLTTATLDACARARPDLDWDVRRFRPNVVLDVDVRPFGEDAWCDGRHLRIGAALLTPRQPTVRCAIPLRAQPGLERQAGLYAALESLHGNHLGLYADVERAAPLEEGAEVDLVDRG
jgi:uncharacterized protein